MSNPVEIARACVGTPFKHQGRIPGVALDCAGLLVHVAASLGHSVSDRADYARMPAGGQLEAAIADNVAAGILRPVALADLAPGDMVLMRFEREDAARHLGMVAGDTLIHAYAVARQVVEHRIDATWRRRFVAAWRFEGGSNE